MRVIGLMSWYEEPASWLAECVASASKLCDHIIAVDGPYLHFPGGLRRPASGPEQADTIQRTAHALGMGCTIHVPHTAWLGGEVEKRDFMFKLGMTFAEPDDWFFRVDADEMLSDVPYDTRDRLAQTEHNVAEVMLWERTEWGDSEHPLRCMFRAIPGIRIEQAHFIVTAPIGSGRQFLSGPKSLLAEPLWDVRLEHRTQMRSDERKRLKRQYSPLINELEKVGDTPND